jgi:hypothetical protein
VADGKVKGFDMSSRDIIPAPLASEPPAMILTASAFNKSSIRGRASASLLTPVLAGDAFVKVCVCVCVCVWARMWI